MTDDEINIAIAKTTGDIIIKGDWTTEEIIQCGAIREIKRYCNDLNAMHEAEKVLKGGMRSNYDAELTLICLRDYNFIWESTASQRAEALLRTLNLWR